MTTLQVITVWSLAGIIPWQIICLRPWARDRRHEISGWDVLRAVSFGIITGCSAAVVYLWSLAKRKNDLGVERIKES